MSVTFDSNGLSTFKAMNRLVDQIEFELHNCKVSVFLVEILATKRENNKVTNPHPLNHPLSPSAHLTDSMGSNFGLLKALVIRASRPPFSGPPF